MQSDNVLVHYMARRVIYNVLGTLGMNRVILRHKFGVPRENGVFNYQYMVCEEDRHRANLIGELVQVRDGHMSQCEVCTLMAYLADYQIRIILFLKSDRTNPVGGMFGN